MKSKFIIYQMLLRLFGNKNAECRPNGTLEENGSGRFGDITTDVLEELKALSVTHVWYTGVIRHATYGDFTVKGNAGSPYAIKDYYDVNPYMAKNPRTRMSEFTSLVNRTHKVGLKVIIDFVPNHLSREYSSSKSSFDDANFYTGKIYDGDWSDTVKLNYNSHTTWEKMRDILLFWKGKGVDGFRVDMVELVPVSFWEWCISEVKKVYPDTIFIAEIYQPHNYPSYIYRGGFDYLYDKSGFYDHVRSISQGDAPASTLTAVWQSLGEFQPRMLNFLENHDEQRIASDFFLGNAQKAKSALYTLLLFNTAPFMLYFGQEFGERGMEQEGFSGIDGRTTIYDFWSLSNIRRFLFGIQKWDSTKYLNDEELHIYDFYKTLLSKAMNIPSFKEGKSFDLGYKNPYSDRYDPRYHFSFLRSDGKEVYLVVSNFSQWDAKVKVYIPFEAYDYFGVGEFYGIDEADELTGMKGVEVQVNSFDGAVVKLL